MVDVFLPGLLPFRSHFSLLDSEQKDRTQVIGSFFQKKTSMVYDKVQSTRGGHTKNFITVGAINHLAQSQLFLYGHICMYDYSLLSIYSTHDFQFPSHINRARERKKNLQVSSPDLLLISVFHPRFGISRESA